MATVTMGECIDNPDDNDAEPDIGTHPSSLCNSPAHMDRTLDRHRHYCTTTPSSATLSDASLPTAVSPPVAMEYNYVAMEVDLEDTESVTSLDLSRESSRSQTPVVLSPPKTSRIKKKKRLSKRSKSNCQGVPSEGETEPEAGQGEHSSKSNKKRGKRLRKHCDTCPLYVKENDTVQNKTEDNHCLTKETENINQEIRHVPKISTVTSKSPSHLVIGEDDQDKQICDKSETTKRKTKTKRKLLCTCKPRKKRPEPEGGSSQPRPMDEYDRIIYNNDPLFSDIDDNPKMDEQVQQEMARFHKRCHSNPDIFQVAQMVNSNTMLKFAIIGTELQNISKTWLKRVI
jgi:hypothetical protein